MPVQKKFNLYASKNIRTPKWHQRKIFQWHQIEISHFWSITKDLKSKSERQNRSDTPKSKKTRVRKKGAANRRNNEGERGQTYTLISSITTVELSVCRCWMVLPGVRKRGEARQQAPGHFAEGNGRYGKAKYYFVECLGLFLCAGFGYWFAGVH